MTIGDSIKRIRMQKEITQKELADALGVSVQAVSAYETGKRRPRMGTLNRFATALGVTVEELTQGVDFLPDDRNPGGGYIPAAEMFRMQAIQGALRDAQDDVTRQALLEQLEQITSGMLDSVLLNVFHVLSNENKQEAIRYCEELAASQPDYDFAKQKTGRRTAKTYNELRAEQRAGHVPTIYQIDELVSPPAGENQAEPDPKPE